MSQPPTDEEHKRPTETTINQVSIARENDERFQSIFQPGEFEDLSQNLFRPSFMFGSNSIIGGAPSIKKSSHDDFFKEQIPLSIHSILDLTKAIKTETLKPTVEKLKKPAETKLINPTIDALLNFCKQDFESEDEIPLKLEVPSAANLEANDHQIRFFGRKRVQTTPESPSSKNIDFETFINALEQKSAFKFIYRCHECPEKEFRSKQALGGHQGQVHKGQSLQYARRIKIKKQNNQTRIRHAFLKRLKAPDNDEAA